MCPERSADRGQSLIVVVAILGLAALVVTLLREADERIVENVRAQRAAEAAAEAAGGVIADYIADLLARDAGVDPVDAALEDQPLAIRAETAARETAAANGSALERLFLERRADEVSVRVQIARQGVHAIARVGVRTQ